MFPRLLAVSALLLAVIAPAAAHGAQAAECSAPAAECSAKAGPAWKDRLAKELPLLGHRNWIVVADSAYPAQTRAGIETIYAGGDHFEAVRAVLEAVDAARHVEAVPLVDAELRAVAESDAPGVAAFRQKLGRLLEGRPVKTMPHEEIIRQLDEAARLFRVLIIKTDMTVPYTTVFLQLECGYWSPEKEARLRQALESAD
jgi:hypothetical protein